VHVAGGLHVWRFTPVARPDDAAWQGRTVWEDFRIVAPNAGAAILLASRYDEELKGLSVSGSQDRQQLASGLEDARLYRVDVCEDDPVVGPAGTVVLALRAGQSRGLANEPSRQERKN
jgi:hypothetical protein